MLPFTFVAGWEMHGNLCGHVGNSLYPVAHKVISDMVLSQLNGQGILDFDPIQHAFDHCLWRRLVPVSLNGQVRLMEARIVFIERVGVLILSNRIISLDHNKGGSF